MKGSSVLIAILCLVIGGIIGAGITYQQVKCKTSAVNVQLKAGENPALTITRTGNDENNAADKE